MTVKTPYRGYVITEFRDARRGQEWTYVKDGGGRRVWGQGGFCADVARRRIDEILGGPERQEPEPVETVTLTPEYAAGVLMLSGDVTEEAVKTAYRALAKAHHPDQGGSDERMRVLVSARDILLEKLKQR